MNARKKTAFYTQLATLTRAGVPLSQSAVALQRYFRQAPVRHLTTVIEQGRPLSEGFEEGGFNEFETRLVAAGERSGRLEIILQQLADYWNREAELKNSIQRQSVYPLLLLHFAVFVGPLALAMTSFPSYVFHVVLNLALFYGAAIALSVFGKKWWQTAPAQTLALRLPLVGKTWRAAAAYRWVQVAGIEYSSGIPLPQAIEDAWKSTGLLIGPARGLAAREHLEAGEPLSTLYPSWPELPQEWEMFLFTGESAGKLHESLAQLAVEAKTNWENAWKTLSEWLPKLFYLAIVGLVVLQIFSAYWTYFSQVNTLIDQLP